MRFTQHALTTSYDLLLSGWGALLVAAFQKIAVFIVLSPIIGLLLAFTIMASVYWIFHRRRKVDWLGGALLMASAIAILLVLTWGGHRYPWSSPRILAMIAAAVAMLTIFVWHAERMVDRSSGLLVASATSCVAKTT